MLKKKNCVETPQKQTMAVIFITQNISVIDSVLTDRRSLLGKRPKSACGKSSSSWFSFSAARNHWIRNFQFFFRYFPLQERLNVIVSKRYGFLSVLGAIIRKNSDERPWIVNGEGFAVHLSTWPSGAKGEWRVSSWLAISNTREKLRYFAWMCTMCLVISSRFIFAILFVSIFLIKFVFLVLTNFLLLHMRIKGKLSWMPSKRNWLERAHASSILYSSFVNQNICAFFNTWKW